MYLVTLMFLVEYFQCSVASVKKNLKVKNTEHMDSKKHMRGCPFLTCMIDLHLISSFWVVNKRLPNVAELQV